MLLSAAAVAEETGVYESLDDVIVGRVFLSPEQRERLDQRRGKAPAPGPTSGVASGKPKKKMPDAAGYIVSSSGESRVWSNGDFVVADEVSNVRFPGDVPVTREPASDDLETADDGD